MVDHIQQQIKQIDQLSFIKHKVSNNCKIKNNYTGKLMGGGNCVARDIPQETYTQKTEFIELDLSSGKAQQYNLNMTYKIHLNTLYEFLMKNKKINVQSSQQIIFYSMNWIKFQTQIIYYESYLQTIYNIDIYKQSLIQLIHYIELVLNNEENSMIALMIAEVANSYTFNLFKFYDGTSEERVILQSQKLPYIMIIDNINKKIKKFKKSSFSCLEQELKGIMTSFQLMVDETPQSKKLHDILKKFLQDQQDPFQTLKKLLSEIIDFQQDDLEPEQFENLNFYKFIIFYERLKFIFTNILLVKNEELKIAKFLAEVQKKCLKNETWEFQYGFCKIIQEIIQIKMNIQYTELSSIQRGNTQEYINSENQKKLWMEFIEKKNILVVENYEKKGIVTKSLLNFDYSAYTIEIKNFIDLLLEIKNKKTPQNLTPFLLNGECKNHDYLNINFIGIFSQAVEGMNKSGSEIIDLFTLLTTSTQSMEINEIIINILQNTQNFCFNFLHSSVSRSITQQQEQEQSHFLDFINREQNNISELLFNSYKNIQSSTDKHEFTYYFKNIQNQIMKITDGFQWIKAIFNDLREFITKVFETNGQSVSVFAIKLYGLIYDQNQSLESQKQNFFYNLQDLFNINVQGIVDNLQKPDNIKNIKYQMMLFKNKYQIVLDLRTVFLCNINQTQIYLKILSNLKNKKILSIPSIDLDIFLASINQFLDSQNQIIQLFSDNVFDPISRISIYIENEQIFKEQIKYLTFKINENLILFKRKFNSDIKCQIKLFFDVFNMNMVRINSQKKIEIQKDQKPQNQLDNYITLYDNMLAWIDYGINMMEIIEDLMNEQLISINDQNFDEGYDIIQEIMDQIWKDIKPTIGDAPGEQKDSEPYIDPKTDEQIQFLIKKNIDTYIQRANQYGYSNNLVIIQQKIEFILNQFTLLGPFVLHNTKQLSQQILDAFVSQKPELKQITKNMIKMFENKYKERFDENLKNIANCLVEQPIQKSNDEKDNYWRLRERATCSILSIARDSQPEPIRLQLANFLVNLRVFETDSRLKYVLQNNDSISLLTDLTQNTQFDGKKIEDKLQNQLEQLNSIYQKIFFQKKLKKQLIELWQNVHKIIEKQFDNLQSLDQQLKIQFAFVKELKKTLIKEELQFEKILNSIHFQQNQNDEQVIEKEDNILQLFEKRKKKFEFQFEKKTKNDILQQPKFQKEGAKDTYMLNDSIAFNIDESLFSIKVDTINWNQRHYQEFYENGLINNFTHSQRLNSMLIHGQSGTGQTDDFLEYFIWKSRRVTKEQIFWHLFKISQGDRARRDKLRILKNLTINNLFNSLVEGKFIDQNGYFLDSFHLIQNNIFENSDKNNDQKVDNEYKKEEIRISRGSSFRSSCGELDFLNMNSTQKSIQIIENQFIKKLMTQKYGIIDYQARYNVNLIIYQEILYPIFLREPFPISINLSQIKNPDKYLLKQVLESDKYNFQKNQVNKLQLMSQMGFIKLVFIINDSDEIQYNIYDSNNIENWVYQKKYQFPKCIYLCDSKNMSNQGYEQKYHSVNTLGSTDYVPKKYFCLFQIQDLDVFSLSQYFYQIFIHKIRNLFLEFYKNLVDSDKIQIEGEDQLKDYFFQFWNTLLNNKKISAYLDEIQNSINIDNNQFSGICVPQKLQEKMIKKLVDESKNCHFLLSIQDQQINELKNQINLIWHPINYIQIIHNADLYGIINTPFLVQIFDEIIEKLIRQYSSQEKLIKIYDEILKQQEGIDQNMVLKLIIASGFFDQFSIMDDRNKKQIEIQGILESDNWFQTFNQRQKIYCIQQTVQSFYSRSISRYYLYQIYQKNQKNNEILHIPYHKSMSPIIQSSFQNDTVYYFTIAQQYYKVVKQFSLDFLILEEIEKFYKSRKQRIEDEQKQILNQLNDIQNYKDANQEIKQLLKVQYDQVSKLLKNPLKNFEEDSYLQILQNSENDIIMIANQWMKRLKDENQKLQNLDYYVDIIQKSFPLIKKIKKLHINCSQYINAVKNQPICSFLTDIIKEQNVNGIKFTDQLLKLIQLVQLDSSLYVVSRNALGLLCHSNFVFYKQKLNKLNLVDFNMSGSQFFNCCFENINFQNTDLSSSYFYDCKFESCQFLNSILKNSNFLKTKMISCYFQDTDLGVFQYIRYQQYLQKNQTIQKMMIHPDYQNIIVAIHKEIIIFIDLNNEDNIQKIQLQGQQRLEAIFTEKMPQLKSIHLLVVSSTKALQFIKITQEKSQMLINQISKIEFYVQYSQIFKIVFNLERNHILLSCEKDNQYFIQIFKYDTLSQELTPFKTINFTEKINSGYFIMDYITPNYNLLIEYGYLDDEKKQLYTNILNLKDYDYKKILFDKLKKIFRFDEYFNLANIESQIFYSKFVDLQEKQLIQERMISYIDSEMFFELDIDNQLLNLNIKIDKKIKNIKKICIQLDQQFNVYGPPQMIQNSDNYLFIAHEYGLIQRLNIQQQNEQQNSETQAKGQYNFIKDIQINLMNSSILWVIWFKGIEQSGINSKNYVFQLSKYKIEYNKQQIRNLDIEQQSQQQIMISNELSNQDLFNSKIKIIQNLQLQQKIMLLFSSFNNNLFQIVVKLIDSQLQNEKKSEIYIISQDSDIFQQKEQTDISKSNFSDVQPDPINKDQIIIKFRCRQGGQDLISKIIFLNYRLMVIMKVMNFDKQYFMQKIQQDMDFMYSSEQNIVITSTLGCLQQFKPPFDSTQVKMQEINLSKKYLHDQIDENQLICTEILGFHPLKQNIFLIFDPIEVAIYQYDLTQKKIISKQLILITEIDENIQDRKKQIQNLVYQYSQKKKKISNQLLNNLKDNIFQIKQQILSEIQFILHTYLPIVFIVIKPIKKIIIFYIDTHDVQFIEIPFNNLTIDQQNNSFFNDVYLSFYLISQQNIVIIGYQGFIQINQIIQKDDGYQINNLYFKSFTQSSPNYSELNIYDSVMDSQTKNRFEKNQTKIFNCEIREK